MVLYSIILNVVIYLPNVSPRVIFPKLTILLIETEHNRCRLFTGGTYDRCFCCSFCSSIVVVGLLPAAIFVIFALLSLCNVVVADVWNIDLRSHKNLNHLPRSSARAYPRGVYPRASSNRSNSTTCGCLNKKSMTS